MVVDLLNLPGHKFKGGEDGGFGVHGRSERTYNRWAHGLDGIMYNFRSAKFPPKYPA